MKAKYMIPILFAAVACSCGGKETIDPGIAAGTVSTSPQSLTIGPDGGSLTLDVTASDSFQAYCNDDWVAVEPGYSKESSATVTVKVDAMATARDRSTEVVIKCGSTRHKVPLTQTGNNSIPTPEGYTLVWSDEFEKGSTLGSDWTHEIKADHWVNNELQNYVNHQTPSGKLVTEVEDGCLKIHCLKDSDGKIYSGRVYAKKSTGWKYGWIEASIKLPVGKGSWPAFWMMPVNFTKWPDDGEIDIMEEVGAVPNEVVSTIHCNKYNNKGTNIESARRNIGTAESEFHVYACEWTAQWMKFYVDGKMLLQYNNDGTGKDAWPFDAPFYVILNVAWGGDWGGFKGIDESALPLTMEVEYVRVFQKS